MTSLLEEDSFAEFLKRSCISEWREFYCDLGTVNKFINQHLSYDGNPDIASAFKTLSALCVDYELGVRCSFSDGWVMPRSRRENTREDAATPSGPSPSIIFWSPIFQKRSPTARAPFTKMKS